MHIHMHKKKGVRGRMSKRARQEENKHVKELVKINAGGKIYYTTQETLTTNFPDSMIATLFKHKEMINRDDEGAYFLDVDPVLFGAILHVLRRPSLVDVVPLGVAEETWWYELDYWGIKEYSAMTVELKEKEPEMPASLATKIQLLEEKRVVMKKLRHQGDLLILDKVLEWLHVDQILLTNCHSMSSAFFMPENVLYLDCYTNNFTRKKDNPSCNCVAAYLWNYKERFLTLLKDTIKFTSATIEIKKPDKPYTFEGKEYPVVPNKLVVYVRVQQSYDS